MLRRITKEVGDKECDDLSQWISITGDGFIRLRALPEAMRDEFIKRHHLHGCQRHTQKGERAERQYAYHQLTSPRQGRSARQTCQPVDPIDCQYDQAVIRDLDMAG